ncbi:MAG TPA: glycosyltransferase [Solirubrobacteraceae bacterium]
MDLRTPPGYEGVELLVSVLTEALVRGGHAVTLFCAPGFLSSAWVVALLDDSHPDEIERSPYEVDHVARASEVIDLAAYDHRFDIVHDHCGFTALAMADRLDTPLVQTLDGQFTAGARGFLRPARVAKRRSWASAGRSSRRRRRDLNPVGSIPNPSDVCPEAGREHRFFCEDTRFLARWVLRGRTDADVEILCDIGRLVLRAQSD